MSDTQDQDQTMFVRTPGASPETADGRGEQESSPDQTSRLDPAALAQKPAARAPSLDTVDFDVTAGFGDDPAPAGDEFFDITQGAESPARDETASPPPAAPESPVPTAVVTPDPVPAAVVTPDPVVAPTPPSPAPEAVPAATGRGGSFVVIAIIVVAIAAAALWLAMR